MSPIFFIMVSSSTNQIELVHGTHRVEILRFFCIGIRKVYLLFGSQNHRQIDGHCTSDSRFGIKSANAFRIQ